MLIAIAFVLCMHPTLISFESYFADINPLDSRLFLRRLLRLIYKVRPQIFLSCQHPFFVGFAGQEGRRCSGIASSRTNSTFLVSSHSAKGGHRSRAARQLWFKTLVKNYPFVVLQAQFLNLTKCKRRAIHIQR
jgi:hypothetical protein